jgi:hypothetical protein
LPISPRPSPPWARASFFNGFRTGPPLRAEIEQGLFSLNGFGLQRFEFMIMQPPPFPRVYPPSILKSDKDAGVHTDYNSP